MDKVGRGGTITLRVEYRDGANNLVDPTSPTLEILNPSAVSVASNLVPTRESQGLYRYNYTVAADAPLGVWVARWRGSINGVPVTGDEQFEVVLAGTIIPAVGANLLTLDEYKSLVGLDPANTKNDAQINALLGPVSRAVRSYADRTFEISQSPASARTFLYDGSGVLEVDDFTSLASVTTDTGVSGLSYALTEDQYTLMPQDSADPVFYWIIFHGGPRAPNGEMGFERNLDRMEIAPKNATVTVTATWGWPAVPSDVKLAAAWAIQDAIKTPQGPTSEAIEGYSRSWGQAGQGFPVMALPNRSRDLLAAYQRSFA